VLRIREEARRRGMTADDLKVAASRDRLADRKRFSAQGQARLRLADHQPVDRTLPVRGVLPNPDRVLLPAYYVRVRVPFEQQQNALLGPDIALGSDQSGRYVLSSTARMWSNSARSRPDRWKVISASSIAA